MPVLVVNAGSTSVKYKLFDRGAAELSAGMIEAADRGFSGAGASILEQVRGCAIERIGFRVVHGGESFTAPTRISDAVLARLDELGRLAPLHNPPAVETIRAFRELLPDTPQYAVFDTAFHSSLPPEAFLYSIPYELYDKHGIRKYGFHGISHRYVSGKLTELEPGADRQIICHLGGGASITAVKQGRSIETSMGFTPLEGLTMATRSGDLDVGVVFHLMEALGLSLADTREMLNKQSGLLGLSGQTADMRGLLEKQAAGDRRAGLAIDVYIHDIRRYIGAYAALLGGVDVLAFTAGVGAASSGIRARACATLGHLGIALDDAANPAAVGDGGAGRISAPGSVPVWVVPTDEERQIFLEIAGLER